MAALIALCVITVVGAAPILIAALDALMSRYEPMCQCPPRYCDGHSEAAEVCCVGKEEDCE